MAPNFGLATGVFIQNPIHLNTSILFFKAWSVFLLVVGLHTGLSGQKKPCEIPANPLGKKPQVEIKKYPDKAVIRINAFPPVEYFFAPEEKEDFPGSVYDATFSDIQMVKVGEPCELAIIGMTIQNMKKASKVYHYRVEPPVSASTEEVTENLKKNIDREVEISGALEVKSKKIRIIVWDNQSVDGDSLSIFLNGIPVVEHYALVKQPRAFEATLSDGVNVVTLFAHNLGKFPPNTAAITIDDGKAKQTRILSSTLQKCEAIELVLKE